MTYYLAEQPQPDQSGQHRDHWDSVEETTGFFHNHQQFYCNTCGITFTNGEENKAWNSSRKKT